MRWTILVTTAIAVCALGTYLYYPYSPGGRQAKNMEMARLHLPKLHPLLTGDPRFAQVSAGEYTGQGGSLGLHGYVKSDEDLLSLRQLVSSTSPPVSVAWHVEVIPAELYDSLATPAPGTPTSTTMPSATQPANDGR